MPFPRQCRMGSDAKALKLAQRNRAASKKPANTGVAGFAFSRKARLRRGRAGGRGREAGGVAAVAALVRNHDGNSGNNGRGAKPDNQRASADFLSRLNASGLAGRQHAISGESRSCNHRRHRDRGNNTFKTEHLASPVIYGGNLSQAVIQVNGPYPIPF